MSFDRPCELTDPKAMCALAHPVRLALIEELADAGTLTATEAGERVRESPGDASFHLRQLAKYGYVEQAEGGSGRRRPWKLPEQWRAVTVARVRPLDGSSSPSRASARSRARSSRRWRRSAPRR